ncbi:MAG: S-layer homology domain-containing protein [Thermoanaerobaculia bacterium]
MNKVRRIPRLLGTSMLAMLCSSLGNAQVRSLHTMLPTTTIAPKEFGTMDYVYTAISGLSFNGQSFYTGPLLSRQPPENVDTHYYATLNIPLGAVIDYIGLDNWNDGTPAVMGLALYENGNLIAGISSTPHTYFALDANQNAIGFLYTGNAVERPYLVLDIEVAPSPNIQYFLGAQVAWRRTVSPAPGTATFNDVPTTHPFFQYIEAIHAAGITAGCGGGNFCPDQPITRKQEAAFIAKALGLHWPH